MRDRQWPSESSVLLREPSAAGCGPPHAPFSEAAQRLGAHSSLAVTKRKVDQEASWSPFGETHLTGDSPPHPFR